MATLLLPRPSDARGLIGRVVVLEALDELPALARPSRSGPLAAAVQNLEQALIAQLVAECVTETTAGDDDRDLRRFLEDLLDVAERLSKRAIARQTGDPRKAQRTLSAAFIQELRLRGTQATGPPDALTRICEWSLAATFEAYADVGVELSPQLDALTITVLTVHGAPQAAVAPFLVAGSAKWPLGGGGPVFRVLLEVGQSIDLRSWYALPYALIHELVCHAAQGPFDASCSGPGSDDPFADGLMDTAAALVHVLALDALDPLPSPEKHADYGTRLRNARAGTEESSRRRHGIKLGGELLRVCGLSPVEFLEIALAVNASDIGHDRRRRFVLGLEQALFDDERKGSSQVSDWLREYRSQLDWRVLVDRAVALADEHTDGRSVFG